VKGKSGFTLLEILVVVLIITVLATIVGINVVPELVKSKVATAKAQIGTFRTALNLYRMNHGDYPTQQQGLSALCLRPQAPPVPDSYPEEGYLETRNLPRDPWGNDYVYIIPGPGGLRYEIVSYGADGEPGGDGDSADILASEL
jgi:general secretion pathway protein G